MHYAINYVTKTTTPLTKGPFALLVPYCPHRQHRTILDKHCCCNSNFWCYNLINHQPGWLAGWSVNYHHYQHYHQLNYYGNYLFNIMMKFSTIRRVFWYELHMIYDYVRANLYPLIPVSIIISTIISASSSLLSSFLIAYLNNVTPAFTLRLTSTDSR